MKSVKDLLEQKAPLERREIQTLRDSLCDLKDEAMIKAIRLKIISSEKILFEYESGRN